MDAIAAFHRANELREVGDLDGLKKLFESGDAAVKAGVLNGLTGEPGHNPAMGPGIIALAVEGASHPSPEVRHWACFVFQDQSGWGVNVADAVGPLLTLLSDSDAEVRRMAAFATGNVYRRRFDFAPHFSALRRLLGDKALYVPEAAAWALAKMSRARHDIGLAVPQLLRVLASGQDYAEPRKAAARALLHHAKKSRVACDQVKQAIASVKLDHQRKEVKRFLDRLSGL
jgi:HEAT repeat protein